MPARFTQRQFSGRNPSITLRVDSSGTDDVEKRIQGIVKNIQEIATTTQETAKETGKAARKSAQSFDDITETLDDIPQQVIQLLDPLAQISKAFEDVARPGRAVRAVLGGLNTRVRRLKRGAKGVSAPFTSLNSALDKLQGKDRDLATTFNKLETLFGTTELRAGQLVARFDLFNETLREYGKIVTQITTDVRDFRGSLEKIDAAIKSIAKEMNSVTTASFKLMRRLPVIVRSFKSFQESIDALDLAKLRRLDERLESLGTYFETAAPKLKQFNTQLALTRKDARDISVPGLSANLRTLTNVEKVLAKITKESDKSSRSVRSFGRSAQRSFEQADTAATKLYRTVKGIFTIGFAYEFFRVFSLLEEGIGLLTQESLRYNVVLEQNRLAIAAILGSTRELVFANGESIRAIQAYPILLTHANQVQLELNRRAIDTLGTAEDLTEVYRRVLAFTGDQKAENEELLSLAQAITNATALAGLNTQERVIETRQLLNLDSKRGQLLIEILNLDIKQLRVYKQQGELVRELNKAFAPIQKIAESIGKTFIGLVESVRSYGQILAGATFSNIFEAAKLILIGIRDTLKEIVDGPNILVAIGLSPDELRAVGAYIARTFHSLLRNIANTIKSIIEFGVRNKNLTALIQDAVFIFAKGARILATAISGLIRVFSPLLGLVTRAVRVFIEFGDAANYVNTDFVRTLGNDSKYAQDEVRRLKDEVSSLMNFVRLLADFALVVLAGGGLFTLLFFGSKAIAAGISFAGAGGVAASLSLISGHLALIITALTTIIALNEKMLQDQEEAFRHAADITNQIVRGESILRDLDPAGFASIDASTSREEINQYIQSLNEATTAAQNHLFVLKTTQATLRYGSESYIKITELIRKLEAALGKTSEELLKYLRTLEQNFKDVDEGIKAYERLNVELERIRANLALDELRAGTGSIKDALDKQNVLIQAQLDKDLSAAKKNADAIKLAHEKALYARLAVHERVMQAVVQAESKAAGVILDEVRRVNDAIKQDLEERKFRNEDLIQGLQHEINLRKQQGADINEILILTKALHAEQIKSHDLAIQAAQATINGVKRQIAARQDALKSLREEAKLHLQQIQDAGTRNRIAASYEERIRAIVTEIRRLQDAEEDAHRTSLKASLERSRAIETYQQELRNLTHTTINLQSALTDALTEFTNGLVRGQVSFQSFFKNVASGIAGAFIRGFSEALVAKANFDAVIANNLQGINGAFGSTGQGIVSTFTSAFRSVGGAASKFLAPIGINLQQISFGAKQLIGLNPSLGVGGLGNAKEIFIGGGGAGLKNIAAGFGNLGAGLLGGFISNKLGFGNSVGGQLGGLAGGIGGGFAGGALLGTSLGAAAGPVGVLIGTVLGSFLGDLLGGLFGPGRISIDKKQIRKYLNEQGIDASKGTSKYAAQAESDYETTRNALDFLGVLYARDNIKKNDEQGLGTALRFGNQVERAFAKAGRSVEYAENKVKELAKSMGVGGLESSFQAIEEILDHINLDEYFEQLEEGGELIRVQDLIAGAIDLAVGFADQIDSVKIANNLLAKSFKDLTKDIQDTRITEWFEQIRDGTLGFEEAIQKVNETFQTSFNLEDVVLDKAAAKKIIEDAQFTIKTIAEAASTAFQQGIQAGLEGRDVGAAFEDAFSRHIENALRGRIIQRIFEAWEEDVLVPFLKGIDFTDPDALKNIDFSEVIKSGREAAKRAVDAINNAGLGITIKVDKIDIDADDVADQITDAVFNAKTIEEAAKAAFDAGVQAAFSGGDVKAAFRLVFENLLRQALFNTIVTAVFKDWIDNVLIPFLKDQDLSTLDLNSPEFDALIDAADKRIKLAVSIAQQLGAVPKLDGAQSLADLLEGFYERMIEIANRRENALVQIGALDQVTASSNQLRRARDRMKEINTGISATVEDLQAATRQIDKIIEAELALYNARVAAVEEAYQKHLQQVTELRDFLIEQIEEQAEAQKEVHETAIKNLRTELDLARKFKTLADSLDESLEQTILQTFRTQEAERAYIQRQVADVEERLLTSTGDARLADIAELQSLFERLLTYEDLDLNQQIAERLTELRNETRAVGDQTTDIEARILEEEQAIKDITSQMNERVAGVREAADEQINQLKQTRDVLLEGLREEVGKRLQALFDQQETIAERIVEAIGEVEITVGGPRDDRDITARIPGERITRRGGITGYSSERPDDASDDTTGRVIRVVDRGSYREHIYSDGTRIWYDLTGNRIRTIPAARGFSGYVDRPTMFLAGEAGRERVDIQPSGQSSISSSRSNLNITLNISGVSDSNDLIQKLKNEIRYGELGLAIEEKMGT